MVRAQVAQLVEHVTENHGVGGSIPPLGTIRHSEKLPEMLGSSRTRNVLPLTVYLTLIELFRLSASHGSLFAN